MGASNISSSKKQRGGNRALLILVISMGVALLGGMSLLVVKLLGGLDDQNAGGMASCEPAYYTLEPGENAQVVAIDGKWVTLAIIHSSSHKTLRTIDMCSGAVRRDLQLKPALLPAL